jgi:hypothetical protein
MSHSVGFADPPGRSKAATFAVRHEEQPDRAEGSRVLTGESGIAPDDAALDFRLRCVIESPRYSSEEERGCS